jgi:hypothetical protein
MNKNYLVINANSFHNVSIMHLDLSENQIEFIDSEAFKDIKNLHSLVFTGNKLKNISFDFEID